MSGPLILPPLDEIASPTDYGAMLERNRERRRRADDEEVIALFAKFMQGDEGDDGGNGVDDSAGP
jgi:hypothetical protein